MPELFSLATPAAQEAKDRRRQMLRTAFGPTIAAALADPTMLEVMVNPDVRLWIDRAAGGRADSGQRLGAAETERIIRLVAAHVRREVTDNAPIVSAELPDTGERFEGVMPPVAAAPCFAISKPAEVPYRLSDYVAARILTPPQGNVLAAALRERRNIVVAGGISSGKTTLVNALLAEVASLQERVLILEDTRELRCAAEDVVALRTRPGVASLADLVRSTLRLRQLPMLPEVPLQMRRCCSMSELISCAEREARIRRQVYPRRLADRKVSRAFADREITKMEQRRC